MSDAPVISLLDRMKARFLELRGRDNVVRKYTNEVKRLTRTMQVTHQMRKVAKAAIREQEKWLREEAAAQIRDEAGVKTIPGFVSKRESAIEFRKHAREKFKIAQAEVRAHLAAKPPNAG